MKFEKPVLSSNTLLHAIGTLILPSISLEDVSGGVVNSIRAAMVGFVGRVRKIAAPAVTN
jgi:hypothetical protein